MKELQNKLNCTFYLDVCHSDCDFNKLYCGFCKNREEFKGAIDPSEKLNIDLSFFLPQPVTSNQGEVIKICLCNVNVQFGLWQLFSMIRRGWTRITSTKFSATQPWVEQFVNSKLSLGVSYVKPKDLVGSYKVCRVLKRL